MKKAGNNPEGERARASRLAITVVEIVLLAVVMLMVYAGGVLLLFDVINRAMGDWFFSPLGIFVVVGIDIVWVAWVIRWQLKNARIKIIGLRSYFVSICPDLFGRTKFTGRYDVVRAHGKMSRSVKGGIVAPAR